MATSVDSIVIAMSGLPAVNNGWAGWRDRLPVAARHYDEIADGAERQRRKRLGLRVA
jgi:hypothetical protein